MFTLGRASPALKCVLAYHIMRVLSGLRAMMVWSMFYLSMDCGGHGATYGAQFRGEMALKGPKTAADS